MVVVGRKVIFIYFLFLTEESCDLAGIHDLKKLEGFIPAFAVTKGLQTRELP